MSTPSKASKAQEDAEMENDLNGFKEGKVLDHQMKMLTALGRQEAAKRPELKTEAEILAYIQGGIDVYFRMIGEMLASGAGVQAKPFLPPSVLGAPRA